MFSCEMNLMFDNDFNGRSYVECTSAAIQALTLFKKSYPWHRQEEIELCIKRAVMFIEKIQASDGSWFASASISP